LSPTDRRNDCCSHQSSVVSPKTNKPSRPDHRRASQRGGRGSSSPGANGYGAATGSRSSWVPTALIALAAIVGLSSMAVISVTEQRGAGGRSVQTNESNVQTNESADPLPWEYDAVTNRHWDPGHGHWHDGPPPPESARTGGGADLSPPAAPSETPDPWAYDPETDRHWHPDHGHWHNGPPPSGANQPTSGSASNSSNPQ